MAPAEILLEPPRGEIDHGFQRSGLRKEMSCVRNDPQRLWPTQSGHGVLIKVNDVEIVATHDQQGWRAHFFKRITR
jgi:hypothetical protein